MRILKGIESGTIYETNSSGKLEITKYINCEEVEVRFVDTGYSTAARMCHIKSGKVKDPLCPSVHGVGFIGVGNHKASDSGKSTKAYKTWQGMLERCYSDNWHKKYQFYIGCSVCDDWHSFQTFAQWYHDNHPNDGGDYQLDKDILVEGNKIYSPDTCMFVTHKDNAIKARAKSYTFKNPRGDIVEVYNLRQFCKDNDLHQGHMSDVSNGKAKQHKGWRLA